MPVTKTVGGVGSFTVNLRQSTPSSVTDACDIATRAFGTVVVTPTWTDPVGLSLTHLLSLSIFTGVLFGRENRTTLTGHHATVWAGGPGQIGPVNESTTNHTRNFTSWFTSDKPSPIDNGSIEAVAPLTTMTWTVGKITRREIWDRVIDYYRSATGNPSLEWRITDQLTIDAGTTSFLYNADQPVALLTPSFDGPDPVLPGINATLEVSDDADDYISRLLFFYNAGATGVNGVNPFLDIDGVAPVRIRNETDNEVATANGPDVAASIVAREDTTRRKLTATTDRPAIMLDIPTGSWVGAWDQETGVVDLTRQYAWRGTVANPVLTRVLGCTMPIEAGMGVYLLNRISGSIVPTDLSEWIVPEAPGARLDLGALDRNYAFGVRSR